MNEEDIPLSNLDHWKEQAIGMIGRCLLITQSAEHMMSFALRIVFKEGILTVDDFTRTDKKTLGGLIRELREKMEVDATFDDLLTQFLEQRNIFAHNLREQPWFDFDSEEGQDQIWHFLKIYFHNTEQVLMAFTAYAFKMGDDIGFSDSEEHRILRRNGFLDRLEREYYPRLPWTLKRRGTPSPAAQQTAKKKPRPNAPCSCGSGRKFKKCCGAGS